ncbi:hypothetical protein GCM10010129_62450 [Streptomyces fumigatiscleroticus]|nr:hypothetical protein GCM10010129_62450 [Streptomyces fumigatiscleroticus]
MPADEVTRWAEADASRARTGPRHAAPRKPLFTRFHMPAGKAIALAAMPTAILMGMGFTPTLALADDKPPSNGLTADEYRDCVAALEGAEDGASASATPSPSASGSASESADDADGSDQTETGTEPAPSATQDTGKQSPGTSSSSDSGSDDDEAEPAPSATTSAPGGSASGGATATPSPSASASGGNLLEDIGNALGDLLTGGKSSESASPTPTASASASANASASDAVKETTDKATETAKDTVRDAAGTASKAAEDTTEAAGETAGGTETAGEDEDAAEATASASPSPSPSASASATTDPEDCPAATDAEGGVDNPLLVPDEPWYLDASSLLLKNASYKGVVEVKTASGKTKKVLKYVISGGTDIGDLHQTVKADGVTYHVQAAEGSTSTIRDGDTVMYTESISGNLLGLIPITFDPENPPPLDIPIIYFTKVKVVQAGQFGGTLHIPGLRQYTTED